MPDPRNITTGRQIPTEHYADQPYIVITGDNAWLCVLTTGGGVEGEPGQHVVAYRSTNRGLSWQGPVDIEPADGPEASYAVLLKVPSGRIYCFYNHNTDNMRAVKADNPPFTDGVCNRVDSLGHFVFKYSDDHGYSWSHQRYDIPMREMAIDRENAYAGAVRFFWNVGKPFHDEGIAYIPLHKVGGFGEGFFTRSEGTLLASANLLTESNPDQIKWETLPDGDIGLRTPVGGGPIAEEQSFVVLSDGYFYCVYRSVDGYPVCTYSRDKGHTWSPPQYQQFANGRLMKHPRAANFVWRCSNGRYLYWFHNHGGHFLQDKHLGINPYDDRNPVWLCGGVEVDTPVGKEIAWSQPEIVLYDDDPFIRISYPDLVEQDGHYYLSETQKNIARVHELDTTLLEGLWNQSQPQPDLPAGCLIDMTPIRDESPAYITLPKLPSFVMRDNNRADYGSLHLAHGIALEMWVLFHDLNPGQIILDNRNETGQGFVVQTTDSGCIKVMLNDGRTSCGLESDPGYLMSNKLQHIVINIDGAASIITIIIDGVLCDGGEYRQFGWGRISPHLRDVNGATQLRIATSLHGYMSRFRFYNRYLRTSEAVSAYHYGVR